VSRREHVTVAKILLTHKILLAYTPTVKSNILSIQLHKSYLFDEAQLGDFFISGAEAVLYERAGTKK
jgi:hypothetical protein